MTEDAQGDETTTERSYWIQRADFSSREYPPVNLVDAEILVRFHNWQLEHAFRRSLLEKVGEDDTCPPGIGFMAEGEPPCILQICPDENGSAHCFLHYADMIHDEVNVSELAQLRMLQLFFRSDYDALRLMLPHDCKPVRILVD